MVKNAPPNIVSVDNEKIFFNMFVLFFSICFIDKINIASVLTKNMFVNIAIAGKKKMEEYFSVGIRRHKTAKSLASPAPHVSVK